MNIHKIVEEMENQLHAALGLLKLSKGHEQKSSLDISRKTEFQKTALKKIFNLTKYPTKQTREDMALLLALSPKTIQIWFQNERKLRRKEERNEDESWRILVNISVITLYNIIYENEENWKNNLIKEN
ncbi:Homeobox protein HD-7 [Nosema granulosis]|uniref:Homeobox protein HD-7 n=1 Tax=Nosema granulosis TaxID=83296 RepID=A0A9P6GX92_9MICR|nr:Homeobox protein HD-7 [Nosema granulosis]